MSGEKLLVEDKDNRYFNENRECCLILGEVTDGLVVLQPKKKDMEDESQTEIGWLFDEENLREYIKLKEDNQLKVTNPYTNIGINLSTDVIYETGNKPAYDDKGQPIDRDGKPIDKFVVDILYDPVIMGGGHNARATDRQDNLEDDGYINYFAPLEAVRDSWWNSMDSIKDHNSWCATLCDPLNLVGIIVISALHTVAAIGASLMVAATLTDKFASDCISQVRSNLPSFSFFRSNNAARGHRRTDAIADNTLDFVPGP